MSVTAYIRELLARGMSMDDALLAAEVFEAAPPQSAAAIRQKRYRNNKRNEASRVTPTVTNVTPSPLKEIPPTPPKENNPSPASPNGSAARAALRPNDRLSERLLEAAGINNFRAERNTGLVSLAPILALIDQGYDLESDILPAIRDIARRGKPFKTWAYVVPFIVEQHQTRAAIPAKPTPQAVDWASRLQLWETDRTWIAGWGPPPDSPGCRAPEEFLKRKAEGQAA
jgi:hypothetical protein